MKRVSAWLVVNVLPPSVTTAWPEMRYRYAGMAFLGRDIDCEPFHRFFGTAYRKTRLQKGSHATLAVTHKMRFNRRITLVKYTPKKSGRQDLNLRSLHPQCSALPAYATARC